MTTLQQQQFPAPKFRPAPDSQTNVGYKIPCADCSWCYIGETGRAFNTRRKEHIRNIKTAAKGSKIANHAWSHEHSIDFNNASLIDKSSFRIRKTLESWHTMATPNIYSPYCYWRKRCRFFHFCQIPKMCVAHPAYQNCIYTSIIW